MKVVGYGDDFMMSWEKKESVENEMKGLVGEFMCERGVRL